MRASASGGMNIMLLGRWIAALLALLLCSPALQAQTVERIKIHGLALEGNLEANSADRDVIVILPDSYARAKQRRYPVVYFLHGFSATADMYMSLVKFDAVSKAMSARGHDMIIVLPDSFTKYGGSMYSTSPTVGDFERFIGQELVAQIDSRYRTLARRKSRGISGHSMGGYGTLRIAMKYPDTFSALYAMSSCCLSPRTITAERGKALETMTMEQVLKGDMGIRGNFAAAAVWSPAPDRPPFYLDLGTRDGVVQPQVLAQWAANAPLAMLPQYLPSLRRMTAIALDVGDKDFLIEDNKAIHAALLRFGIPHGWTIYEGDHGNRVAQRVETDMLPFFVKHLKMK
jgi:S-formylglutathione hydrolase FrmB